MLSPIYGVKPLHISLDNLQTKWAARALWIKDPVIYGFLQKPSGPNHAPYHDGHNITLLPDSPITQSFHLSALPEENLSWGDSSSRLPSNLIDLSIFDPGQEQSKSQGLCVQELDNLMEGGWRIAYIDGTEADGHTASGVFSIDVRNNPTAPYGGYLGPECSVPDAERHAIALALDKEDHSMLAIASDSLTAIDTVKRVAQGGTPRSDIEAHIQSLLLRPHGDVGILWVHSHIGISGNEAADKRSLFESHIGRIGGSPYIYTHEGHKARNKARRTAYRTQTSYGHHRTNWYRQALSAYTWLRSNRGPLGAWLHHIRVIQSPACPCAHPSEDDHHFVFHCPRFHRIRNDLTPSTTCWEALDQPHWLKSILKEGDIFDGVEEYFGNVQVSHTLGRGNLVLCRDGKDECDMCNTRQVCSWLPVWLKTNRPSPRRFGILLRLAHPD